MTFEVIDPGTFTTVQDLGRFGYQAEAIIPSGAMDSYALRAGNLLVGNEEEEAGLEMTLKGATLIFKRDSFIAFTGADNQISQNDQEIPMWTSVKVKAGDEISCSFPRKGLRTYMTISGGVDVPKVLDSKSTYIRRTLSFGGIEGRPLQKGDIIETGSPRVDMGRKWPSKLIPNYDLENIRVILGPQDDAFTKEGIRTFLTSSYKVTPESDRMGIRLDGPKIEHANTGDIISDAIPLGGIQVPSGGKPIIMMVDKQTIGGYAKIAAVISVDISRLAQAKPGSKITFKEVSITEAHKAFKKQEEKISETRQSFQTKSKLSLQMQTPSGKYDVTIKRSGGKERIVSVFDKEYQVKIEIND